MKSSVSHLNVISVSLAKRADQLDGHIVRELRLKAQLRNLTVGQEVRLEVFSITSGLAICFYVAPQRESTVNVDLQTFLPLSTYEPYQQCLRVIHNDVILDVRPTVLSGDNFLHWLYENSTWHLDERYYQKAAVTIATAHTDLF